MQGKKTHEQQKRMYEHKPDMPDPRREEAAPPAQTERRTGGQSDPRFRKTEHRISRGGLNQEDRRHNKPAPERAGGKNGQG
jgi:hypothetical protein